MKFNIDAQFLIGEDTFLHSFSPDHTVGVAFEDDGQAGYFYAITKSENPEVLDGLHIYQVEDVTERQLPTRLQIGWNETGLIAALLINGHCHAVFDFGIRAGYSRNGIPEKGTWATVSDRQLTDEVITYVFGPEK